MTTSPTKITECLNYINDRVKNGAITESEMVEGIEWNSSSGWIQAKCMPKFDRFQYRVRPKYIKLPNTDIEILAPLTNEELSKYGMDNALYMPLMYEPYYIKASLIDKLTSRSYLYINKEDAIDVGMVVAKHMKK